MGGGGKGYVGPPSQIIGGPGPPSSYAYVFEKVSLSDIQMMYGYT